MSCGRKEIVPQLKAKEFFHWFPPVPIGSCVWQAPWGIARATAALNDVGVYQSSVHACWLSFFNFEFVGGKAPTWRNIFLAHRHYLDKSSDFLGYAFQTYVGSIGRIDPHKSFPAPQSLRLTGGFEMLYASMLDMHMLLQNGESLAGWESKLRLFVLILHASRVSSIDSSPGIALANAFVWLVMQRDVVNANARIVGGTALDDPTYA